MCYKILSLLFLLIVITKKSYQKNIIVYSNFQATFNPEFISNFTIDWSLHDNNTEAPAKYVEPITIFLIKDIKTLNIEAKIFHTIHGYVSFDKAFNFCNYLRVRKSNMFIRLIGAEIEKGINFPIKCPFKKGEYHINRMHVPQFFMPSFVEHTDVFTSRLTFTTKFGGQLQKYLVLSVDWQLQEVD